MSMTYKKFRGRYLILVASALVVWTMIVFRMFFIQVVDRGSLGDLIESRFETKVTIPPLRGNFYDRNGKKLTDNIEHFSFAARPSQVKDKDAIARLFSKTFNKSQRYYLNRLQSKSSFIYLERNVNPIVGRELNEGPLPKGIQVESEIRRYYPFGEVAAPLIGLVGTDNHGLSGLEAHYDHQLAGIEGWKEVGSDGRGNPRIRGDFRDMEPTNGDDAYLTIDVDIQVIIEEELQSAVDSHQADKAMAVLVDPSTGDIIALASMPSFNPNSPSDITQESLTAHPIMSAFEPGSTFKVVGATALLEESQVHPMDVFDCERGQFKIHGITIKDWKSFDQLTFSEVLQNSSNIGVIKAMEPLESKKLFNIAREFGFSEKSGIRFPYENEGSLKNSNKWSSVSKSEISIGYEVSVTALQLAMAYASIGNGGILMKPRLIEKLKSPAGYEQDIDKIDAIRRVASESTMNTMSEILEKAVSSGTGGRAFLPGLRIAGKTGTAKKLKAGKYVSEYVASFASFYPANDPDYAMVIVIDHPRRRGYTGGMVAAPVAKEIYRRIYNLRGEAPTPYKPADRTVAKARPHEQAPLSLSGHLLSSALPVMKADNKEFKMPDLMGMTMKNSLSSIYGMSIKPEIHGSGCVIRQKPRPGKPIKPGQSVQIWYGHR